MSRRRVMAIVRKELRDYRRNRYTTLTIAVVPLAFLVQPLVAILSAPAASAAALTHRHELLYLLGIPILAPTIIAAAAVVTERQVGTLEPLLTTPIRREEFLLAKALAPLGLTVLISYAVYGTFILIVAIFAHAGVASALLHGPEVIAQVVFTPLLALCSIWIGLALSTRSIDVRAAQQLSTLANLPLVALAVLVAVGVISATTQLALGAGLALLVLDRLGWVGVSRLFDRERLITGG